MGENGRNGRMGGRGHGYAYFLPLTQRKAVTGFVLVSLKRSKIVLLLGSMELHWTTPTLTPSFASGLSEFVTVSFINPSFCWQTTTPAVEWGGGRGGRASIA